jgi:hypothetical protein
LSVSSWAGGHLEPRTQEVRESCSRPRLDQRTIECEVLCRDQALAPRVLDHALEESLRRLVLDQAIAVLRERRRHDRGGIGLPRRERPLKDDLVFLMDSPDSLVQCASCTSRSQIESAAVSSPMTAWQRSGSTWLVTTVDETP